MYLFLYLYYYHNIYHKIPKNLKNKTQLSLARRIVRYFFRQEISFRP